MIKPHVVVAVALVFGGAAYAQTAAPPSTTPPERLNAPTTMNNPATGTVPPARPVGNQPVANSSAPARGAPVPGANSFTQGQARARIQRHGFSQVSNLKLDSQGIWRGQAKRGGKTVSVALDYQGNVVAQ